MNFGNISSGVFAEIFKETLSGKSRHDLKPLYIQRNSFNLDGIEDIYRIFRHDYFIQDVLNGELTLAKLCPVVFDHDLENPIKDIEFKDSTDRFKLGFLNNYFSQSWSEKPMNSPYFWDIFSKGGIGLRVKVKLSKLLNEFFDTSDEFFMQHYYAGKVHYAPRDDIESWQNSCEYTDFLDSRGLQSAMSLLILPNEVDEEHEVRIIYNFMNENKYIIDKVKLINGFCKLHFDWSKVLDEVLYDSRMHPDLIEELESVLRSKGIRCSVVANEL